MANALIIPKVSLLITAYNAESFIMASITAALSQQYANYEVIVVDDGSEDRTEAICKVFTHDSRFRYLKRNRIGRSRVLNEGISASTGSYIAINDADDLSMPHRLGYATDFLQAHPEAALVATNYVTTHTFRESIPGDLLPHASEKHEPSVWLSAAKLYYSNPIVHSTVVFRRAMWEAVGGYNEQLSMCVDYDLFLRAMRVGKVALLPGSTVVYFKNPKTYFKKKSHLEYLRTLFTIKRQARESLALPSWIRACDAIPVYLIARSVLKDVFFCNKSVN